MIDYHFEQMQTAMKMIQQAKAYDNVKPWSIRQPGHHVVQYEFVLLDSLAVWIKINHGQFLGLARENLPTDCCVS